MAKRACTSCGVPKPATTDHFYRRDVEHLHAFCKVCWNKKAKARYEANPEPVKARVNTRRLADPERKRREDAAWRAKPKNREKAKRISLAWAQSHRDLAAERSRQWQADHPDERRAQGHVKRARLRDAEGIHTAEDVLAIYKAQRGRCHYCRVKLAGTYHVDHKTPLVRGGSNWPANICCACPPCNLAKHDMTEPEFRRSRFRIVRSA